MIRWKIKEVAQQNGLNTAGALARESRVSYGTVYRLWNNPDAGDEVTLDVLLRLAQTLNVKTYDLWDETQPGRQAA